MIASTELRRALAKQLRLQPQSAEQGYRALLSTNAYIELLEDEHLLAEDPVDLLFRVIDLEPQHSTVQLVSGFRGTGKTTALLRLRDLLHDAEYAAIRVDVKDYLSTAVPLGPEEFLLFLAAAAATEAQRAGLIPGDVPAIGLLNRTKGILKRLKVDDASLEVGGDHGKLSLTLALADPDRLATLRKTIAGQIREVAHGVAEDLEALKSAIAKHGKGGQLVVIVDSVEQYRGTYGPDGTALDVQRAMEELFSINADLLDPKKPGLHLIYTVPPYLKWLVGGLGSRFEPGGLCLIPAVKVGTKTGADFEPGIAALSRLVSLRIQAALDEANEPNLTPDDVIAPEEVRKLITRTGGVPRALLQAMHGVVVRMEAHPVPAAQVDLALRRIESEYEVVDEDVDILRQVRPDSPPPIANAGAALALWARQLDVGNVLCYENGEEWYRVNPLVAERVARRVAQMGAAANAGASERG